MKPEKKACEMSVRELAAYIDQSVLKPEFTEADIRRYIREGIDFGCATVCVNPSSLPIACEMCRGTATRVCVVCDFPFGLSTTASKVAQAEEYCSKFEVFELDIVSNYGWLKSGRLAEFTADVKAVVDACHRHGTAVKVILETDALTPEEIAVGTKCAVEAGADFIKSSTGFFTGRACVGATNEVVAIMMEAGAGRIKVKGSGCIRTREHFLELIDMGVDRMGIGYRSTPVVLGLN